MAIGSTCPWYKVTIINVMTLIFFIISDHGVIRGTHATCTSSPCFPMSMEKENAKEPIYNYSHEYMAAGAQPQRGAASRSASLPVALFQGYNAVRGQGMNTAVKGTWERVGGTSFVKCDICFSSTKLIQSLNIDQSLSVGYAPLGTLSQKLQFVQSLSATSTTTFIVVYARHIEGQQVVINVEGLQPGLTQPTSQTELAQFVQYYGDSYLSSRTTGGEYYAVYSYYADSLEQQAQLNADIQAAGIFSGVSVDASLQAKINSLNSAKNWRISFQQYMSGIANPPFPTSDKITEFACQFPSLELTAPAIIQWETAGYEHVPGIGAMFNTIAANRQLLVSPEASAILSKLKALQGSIDSIKKVYNLHGGYNKDTRLDNVKAQADGDEKTVASLKTSYLQDPTKPLPAGPLKLPSVDNGIPSLQYLVRVAPLVPGAHQGPVSFDDVPDAKAYFQQRKKISSLQLRVGPRLVSCLVVTYSGENIQPQTFHHGTHEHDPQSHLTKVLQPLPPDFIYVVAGKRGLVPDMASNQVVTRLAIALDSGDYISGGSTQGSDFSWSQNEDSFIMGFRGSYGWFIDDLQVVYASFSPASWSSY